MRDYNLKIKIIIKIQQVSTVYISKIHFIMKSDLCGLEMMVLHTPSCISNFYQIFCNLGYNSENSGFFQSSTNYFVMNLCLSCAQTVTL